MHESPDASAFAPALEMCEDGLARLASRRTILSLATADGRK